LFVNNKKHKKSRRSRRGKRYSNNMNPSQGFLVITGSTGTSIKNNHIDNYNSGNSNGMQNTSRGKKDKKQYYSTRRK